MKNLIKYISLFIITLCISCVTASADALSDNQKGIEAYLASDYKEALMWYKLAADQGYADAQFNLGLMYSDGTGVPEDDTEALKWYHLAAEQGDFHAQYNLDVMYYNGEDVTKNNLETVKRYRSAVKQGLSRKEQTEYIKGKAREAKRRREAREAAREAAGEEPPFLDDSTKKSYTRIFVKGLVPILLFLALGGLIWLIKFIYRKIF